MILKEDCGMRKMILIGLLVVGLFLSSCEITKIEEGERKGKDSSVQSSDEFSELAYKAKVVKVDFYYNMIIRTLSYKAIVELENTGTENIELIEPRFELLGSESEILHSEEFIQYTQAVLRPGEKGYYFNYCRELEHFKSMDVKGFRAFFDVRETTEDPADFEILDYNVRQTDDGISALGKLKNPNKKDERVQVSVVYYDKDGAVLDVDTKFLNELHAGRTLSFDIETAQNIKIEDRRLKRDEIATYTLIAKDANRKLEKREGPVSFSVVRLNPTEHVVLIKKVGEEE